MVTYDRNRLLHQKHTIKFDNTKKIELAEKAGFSNCKGLYPDTSRNCQLLGGTWYWQANLVGCKNLVFPAFDCSTGTAQALLQQCTAVNGNSVCNTNNAYCEVI